MSDTLGLPKKPEKLAKPEQSLEEQLKETQAKIKDVEAQIEAAEPPPEEIKGDGPIAAAMREGRTKSDPRYLEAVKRGDTNLDLGTYDLKLAYTDLSGQEIGYEAHWIVDSPGRVQKMLSQGYEPVYNDGVSKVGTGTYDFSDNMDTWVSMVTGTLTGGAPQLSYRMKIRKGLSEARQTEKRRNIESVDNQIRTGDFEKTSNDGRYVKTIKYDN